MQVHFPAMLPPVHSHHPSRSTTLVTTVVTVTAIAATAMIAAVGCLRVENNRIIMRDPSEALSFIQDLVDFLGAILSK